MSSRPRIFISHSSHEALSCEIREAVGAALNATGSYRVLLDRIALEPGDAWRARINLWAGGCDAAIVLLSEEALKSPYVAYETSILSYRRTVDPTFVVVPVFLPGVDERAVARSRLAPQRLTEAQGVRGDDAAAVVAAVQAKLAALAIACPETPVERRARRLADLLADVPDRVVEEAARRVDLDLGLWDPAGNERLRLAVRLLSVGMLATVGAMLVLEEHYTHVRRPDAFRELVDVVGSAWVDPRSVECIPAVASGGRGARALGSNARTPLVAEMYVTCARTAAGDPSTGWHFASCDDVTGEQVLPELIGKVERALADKLSGGDAERLYRRLAAFARAGEKRVVVALAHPGVDRAVLDGLRARFPATTFFLLLGDAALTGAPLSDAAVEWLLPELGEGDEERVALDRDDFGLQFSLV